MRDDFAIVDDVLGMHELDLIWGRINAPDQRWEFRARTCEPSPSVINHDTVDFGMLIHKIAQTREGREVVEDAVLHPVLTTIRETVENTLSVNVMAVVRSKINLTFPFQANGKTMEVHADAPNPRVDPSLGENREPFHLSALLFLNDVDGDFVLYNERPYDMREQFELTERERVSPVKNRLVIFDSSRFHAGIYSTADHRVVMNTIFLVND